MTWKGIITFVFVFLVVTGLLFTIHGCCTMAIQSDNQEVKDWQNFVMQHRCNIVPTHWYESNRWQCDGFQVEHF
jgi:hypothetical protein